MTTSSAYFAVKLPPSLRDEELTKIYSWGKSNCLQSNLIRLKDGGYLMITQKADARDLRSRQRLMGTNLKNWGLDVVTRQKGWLSLLTEDEYNAFSQNPEAADTPSPREGTQHTEVKTVPSRCNATDVMKTQLTLPRCLLTAPPIKT